MKRLLLVSAMAVAALAARPQARAGDQCAGTALAISGLGFKDLAEFRQRLAPYCTPGQPIRVLAQDASRVCDFGKQIVPEGRGVMICILRQ